MDLSSIEAFVTVAKCGSFSKASQRLHVTQPAISKRVATLETELGAQLFNRIARKISLTEAGKQLLPKAQQLVQQAQDLTVMVSNLSDEVSGNLSIAIAHHIGLHRMPPVLRQYHAQYPNVQLDIHFQDSDAAYLELLDGDIEFTHQVEDKIWPFTKKKIVKLSKRKIKKGIKKAIRFGHYFGEKIKDKEGSKWGVKTMKTLYAFSLKGKSGVVTIKGEPSVEIAYTNTNFNKTVNYVEKGVFDKDWGLNAIRVRARFKGGVEIPWLAKFELKPFVETYYK